jgi:tetratricopeptide (TPR) repeat protein
MRLKLPRIALVAYTLFLSAATAGQTACQSTAGEEKNLRMINICTKVIDSGKLHDSDLAFALMARANAYQWQGEFSSAVADYTSAIKFYPESPEMGLNFRGNVYNTIGDFDHAIEDFTSVIRLNPKNSGAYVERAAAYIGIGNYNLAISDYSEAIRLDNTELNLPPNLGYLGRGWLYRSLQRYDEANSDYTELIRLKQDNWAAYEGRAMAYFEAGDYGHAKDDLEIASRIRGTQQGLDFSPAVIDYLIQWREGIQNKSLLEVQKRALDQSKMGGTIWYKVYQLLLTDSIPSDLLSSVEIKPTKARAASPTILRCNLDGILGEWYLLKNRYEEARRQFAVVVSNCGVLPTDAVFYPLAKAELRHLETIVSASGAPSASTPSPQPVANTPSAAASPASASTSDKRVALVIGNSAYRNLPALDNPKNDAELVAGTLRSLGFKLVGGGAQLDLDKAGFDRVVQQFGVAIQDADVGLFYFAGHGVQVRDANYLVPIDANPTREADVDFQMLDANLVLRQMADSGAKLNLVLLDACRNNPFGGRGFRAINSGLAEMQAPEGTLISFATKPGAVARDGNDGHSPYTEALANEMRRPGVDVFRAFNDVGLEVMKATGGEQQPWISISPIKGDFYFAGSSAGGSKDP